MSYKESEQQRLKRLRENQLRARDPLVKERRLNKTISARNKEIRKSDRFVKNAAKSVSHKVKGIYVGAIIGLIVMIVLPMFVDGTIANVLGIAAFPVLMILGFILGASFDWRDELSRDIK